MNHATTQRKPALIPTAKPARSPVQVTEEAGTLATTATHEGCVCGGGCPRCRNESATPLQQVSSRLTTTLPAEVMETLAAPGRPLDAHTRRTMQGLFASAGLHASTSASSVMPTRVDSIAISQEEDAAEQEADFIAEQVLAFAATPPQEPPLGGPDFASVRVHTDALAARSAQQLGANAYSFGTHIVMGSDRYAPTTMAGMRLLAHELTHTLQPRSQPIVQRDGDGQSQQPNATLTVSLDGMQLEFPGATLSAGVPRPQMMAMILRRLLGLRYKPGIENDIIADLEKGGTQFLGKHLAKSGKVEAGTTPNGVSIDLFTTFKLLQILQERGLPTTLTDSHKELLRNALFTNLAWQEVKANLPDWYTEWLFRREMAQHGAELAAYRNAKAANDDSARIDAVAAIEEFLLNDAIVVDMIRRDTALLNAIDGPTSGLLEKRDAESCTVAYSLLFDITPAPGMKLTAAPTTVNQTKAADFLRFMRTQPKLMAGAIMDNEEGHKARLQLLGRFGRFWVKGRSGTGDEKILQKPALANTPPWPAVLSSTPQVQPPLYDAALETDHAFTMSLQWQHFTDAWVRYSYMFEFIQIPDSTLSDAPDVSQAAGDKPKFGKVMDTRLARVRRYNAADLERVREKLGGLPFGNAATNLVEANNALRYVGTVIKTVLEKITEPSYVARYVFPSAGMYIVRCRALPVKDDDAEIVRMPSVAFLPIVARSPDEMAIGQVKDASRFQFDARLRIAEIQALFDSPFPPENESALRQEMADLQAILLAPAEAMDRRRQDLNAQIAAIELRIKLRDQIHAIEATPEAQRDNAALSSLRQQLAKAGGSEGNNWDDGRLLKRLTEQRDSASNTIEMHAKRTKNERGLRFTPNVSFVSDLGHSLQLSIEMYDRGEGDGVYQVYMSDITTPDSGEMLGTAPPTGANPKLQAIKNGLKKLLEESSDYGRGRVAVEVDGQIHVIQIQAGTGRMLSEAVESATMVASLAVIVAAPFTGGSSLYLLLPLGAIGAIPSAYRLYQRHDENRLRLDFAAAMDVVNLVGGVLGLAQVATPLRAVRLGKVLMVMGIGADGAGILMMGAGLAMQLDALRELPEHERAAKMLEILGGAMLQIGIQAGGAVMHARYQSHRSAAAGNDSPAKATAVDEPGFHAAPKDAGQAPRIDVPAPANNDRSMAGNLPSQSGAPVPKPAVSPKPPPAASAAAKGSPEHLFDKLGKGVDRSLPPQPTLDPSAKPPKQGEYQRGIKSADAAYDAYNRALASAPGREAAIYHHPDTGEYRVMIGSEVGVHGPDGLGWNAVLHFHPNEGNALRFRLPAPADFKGLIRRYFAEGALVREFIEFDIPGVGRGRTEYGIDPANAEPFYVVIHQPDGSSRTVRFANDGHYSAYWGDHKIALSTDSPVYAAMVRDIETYLSSIGADQRGSFGPKDKSTSDAASPAQPSPTQGGATPGKSVAGSAAAASSPAMQTGTGDLTDAGVAFLREKFDKVSEGKGRSVAMSSLSDTQIKERFTSQPSWLEAIVLAEARADWLGRSTKTDFLLSNPNQNFEQIAARLSKAAMAGGTGHWVHDSILSWSVRDFVNEMLLQKDPGFTAAYNACEFHADPAFKKKWLEFKNSQVQGDMSGFFLGTVGKKRPDLVEVLLSQDSIHIADATFDYQNPIHNFKSAFYKAVMERLINVKTVTSTDYRAPLRQTPL